MQLSDLEKKMVARLRKRKQTFVRLRWLFLFTGVINVGIGIFGFVILLRCLHLVQIDSAAAVTVALAAPIVYFFVWFGTYILADTLIHWHGRPEVDLLLKLIEESRDVPNK